MLGMRVRYEGVPFFWTSQFGKTIRYAGYASKPDDVVIHGSISAPLAEVSFTVFYVLGERVAAVATFNRDPQAVAAMELLRLGEMPSPRQLRGVDSLDLQVRLTGRQAFAGARLSSKAVAPFAQEYLKQRVAAGAARPAAPRAGGVSSTG